MIQVKKRILNRVTKEVTYSALDKKTHNSDTDTLIDMNAVKVKRINWDDDKGIMLVKIAVGAEDGNGKFHRDMRYPLVPYKFSREWTPKLWTKYDLDNTGPTIADVEKMLTEEKPAISTIARGIWKIDGIVPVRADNTEIIPDPESNPEDIQ